LLGNIYGWQCEQAGRSINVLGATSGDTGAAAIHGLLGKPNAAIFILYPEGRVSPLQERQMTCTGAANVHAIAIDGSFDDAQRVLKDIFANKTFSAQHRLSAATGRDSHVLDQRDVGSSDPLPMRPHHGEGVGLSIIKRLCELLDARLELISSGESGTIFRVVLPRSYSDKA
jgi:hypothetical protein